jgi:DNA-directed RNA polymerase alpha subunit
MNYKREKDICFLFIKNKISFNDFKLLINQNDYSLNCITKDNLNNIYIEDLGFSVRAYNVLKSLKVNTLYELSQKTANELLMSKACGKKSIEEYNLALSAYSLTLKQ